MSFEEGFDAITKVKASAQKLSDSVDRIAQLESDLDGLQEAHADIKLLLDNAKTTLSTLELAAKGLVDQREQVEDLANTLPSHIQEILSAAEGRLVKQHAELERVIHDIPVLIEGVVEKKLETIVFQLETRMTERLRDEMKDTRTTLREAFEINASRVNASLDETRKELLAEMPRSILGRRGRSAAQ